MMQTLMRFDSAESVAGWSAIDDGVMGGLSRSRLRFDPAGFAVFEGAVSLENNGGFASVRSSKERLGVALVQAYTAEVCGDGRRYKLNLRTEDEVDAVNYQASFEAPAGQWLPVLIPVAQFRPTRRGRILAGPVLDTSRVCHAGLMIADRQAGRFRLAIRSLGAHTA